MRYRQGGAYLHAAPISPGVDFPAISAAPTFGLIRHCQQSLPDYKIPRLVEFRKADLPKTAVGNVLKRVLRDHFRSGSP